MALLDALTAIAGAIRVEGASWLKHLIGRDDDNNATMMKNLMSSISQEVCELWKGKSIIRSTGQPEIKQIIHLPAKKGDISPESFITMNSKTWSKDNKYRLKERDTSDEDIKSEKSIAPSIEQHSQSSAVSDDAKSDKKDNIRDIESHQLEDTINREEHKDMPLNISPNIHCGSNSAKL